MSIRITCPACSATLSVKDEHAGRAVKCPKCEGVIPVPAPGSAPAPAPRPAPPLPFEDFDEPTPAPRGAKSASRPASDPDERPRKPARFRDEDEEEDEDEDDRPRSRRPARKSGGLGDYLTFRKMVVPVVIQIIFWFLVLIVLGVALVFAVGALASGKTETVAIGIAAVLIGAPLYILLIRMYCEVLIVIFRMNDTLTDIRNILDRRN